MTMNSFAIGKVIKGNGIYKSETRDIAAFTNLVSGGPINVEIAYGTSSELKIEGDENILPYIETYVKEGTLKIKVKDGNYVNPKVKLNIKISMTFINSISQSGSGSITGNGDFENNSTTKFNISGSGRIDLRFGRFNGADISMSGSGTIELKGTINGDLNTHQSGSGHIDCASAPCDNAIASINGSGSIKINAAKSLDARISGSGDIYYAGTPQINTHVSGSGRVHKI